ncbi:MAG: hypothetical protein RLZZ117_777 [Cyanobacteriota bacterium]|jgi:hypothetical protein
MTSIGRWFAWNRACEWSSPAATTTAESQLYPCPILGARQDDIGVHSRLRRVLGEAAGGGGLRVRGGEQRQTAARSLLSSRLGSC